MSDLRIAAMQLSALASLDRLELLSMVARTNQEGKECTATAVASTTGRGVRPVLKDAARLAECGLLRLDGSTMTASLHGLREAADLVDRTFPIAPLLQEEPELASFFSHGQLVNMPDDPGRRLRLARLVAQLIPAGQSLSEAEVNRILAEVHPDHAAMRRMLVDLGLLTRRPGHDYRRTEDLEAVSDA